MTRWTRWILAGWIAAGLLLPMNFIPTQTAYAKDKDEKEKKPKKPPTVPEPGTLALTTSGLLGAALLKRKFKTPSR